MQHFAVSSSFKPQKTSHYKITGYNFLCVYAGFDPGQHWWGGGGGEGGGGSAGSTLALPQERFVSLW